MFYWFLGRHLKSDDIWRHKKSIKYVLGHVQLFWFAYPLAIWTVGLVHEQNSRGKYARSVNLIKLLRNFTRLTLLCKDFESIRSDVFGKYLFGKFPILSLKIKDEGAYFSESCRLKTCNFLKNTLLRPWFYDNYRNLAWTDIFRTRFSEQIICRTHLTGCFRCKSISPNQKWRIPFEIAFYHIQFVTLQAFLSAISHKR